MAIKVTTMIGDNYGSALQAYALQQVIKEIGGRSSVVNLRPKSYPENIEERWFSEICI